MWWKKKHAKPSRRATCKANKKWRNHPYWIINKYSFPFKHNGDVYTKGVNYWRMHNLWIIILNFFYKFKFIFIFDTIPCTKAVTFPYLHTLNILYIALIHSLIRTLCKTYTHTMYVIDCTHSLYNLYTSFLIHSLVHNLPNSFSCR